MTRVRTTEKLTSRARRATVVKRVAAARAARSA